MVNTRRAAALRIETSARRSDYQPRGKTPRARFIEWAPQRVEAAIKRLELIETLANPRDYEYSPAEAERLVSVLRKKVDDIAARFENGGQTRRAFELDNG